MSFACAKSGTAIVSPSPTEKETVAVDILSIIYFKNNLRIIYEKTFDGYYLEFSSAIS
jgi:hypothetical protein